MMARLNLGSSVVVLPLVYGLWTLAPWASGLGVVGIVGGQLWALNGYSWLYADLTVGMNEKEHHEIGEGDG